MLSKRLSCSCILFSIAAPVVVQASRYASYDYDLTTPQFTPDGRLLQVEYATKACVREGSNPLLSVGFFDEDDSVLIMATISSGAGADEDGEPSSSSNNGQNAKAQYRIIEVPISAFYSHLLDSTTPMSTITTSSILIGLSGHLSDATSLLQTIYSKLEDEQSAFGWHRLGISPIGQDIMNKSSLKVSTTETALRLARVSADLCQKHAFGGGQRPIGASLLICAADVQQRSGRVVMCRTDPSGNLHSVSSNTEMNGKEVLALKTMISGGSYKSQSKLQSKIDLRLKELHNTGRLGSEKRTHQVLKATVLSLLDEWKTRQGLQSLECTNDTNGPRNFPLMEVVFVSSKMGSVRLSENDLYALLKDSANN